MSKECIGYNDITKTFVFMGEEKILSLNARFDTKPENMKVKIWGYELCNGAEWKDFLNVVNKLGKEKADLEAKLAESEKVHEKIVNDLVELEQQLAEKDFMLKDFEKFEKKFLKLKEQKPDEFKLINLEEDVEMYQKALVEKENEKVKEISDLICVYEGRLTQQQELMSWLEHKVEEHNQDKISFAVEQINILVDMLTHRAELIKTSSRESAFVFDVHDLSMCSQDLIEQLKEGK